MAGLRSLQWRAAIMFVGAGLVFAYVVGTGGTSYIVQIDYTWAQNWLDSSVVEIDGDSVGILQRYGRSQFVTGFEVEPGQHTVHIVSDECESEVEVVELSAEGSRLAVLMADYEDGFTCQIALR